MTLKVCGRGVARDGGKSMLKVAEKLTTKVSNPSRLSYFPNRCTVVPSSNLVARRCRGGPKPLGRDLFPTSEKCRVLVPG